MCSDSSGVVAGKEPLGTRSCAPSTGGALPHWPPLNARFASSARVVPGYCLVQMPDKEIPRGCRKGKGGGGDGEPPGPAAMLPRQKGCRALWIRGRGNPFCSAGAPWRHRSCTCHSIDSRESVQCVGEQHPSRGGGGATWHSMSSSGSSEGRWRRMLDTCRQGGPLRGRPADPRTLSALPLSAQCGRPSVVGALYRSGHAMQHLGVLAQ